MQVIPVPCLSDNYAYLVAQGRQAAVVDPSQADPVLRAIDEHRLKLTEIWLTHHHWDHVGGIEPLIEECPIAHVRGSRYDADHQRIPRQTDALSDGDSFEFGDATVDILEIPGHTLFVADACSGLTAIVTLLPVGCVVAYFLARGWWRRLVVVASVVPLAMAANVVRVVATVMLVDTIGIQAAEGFLHESFGIFTYVVGTLFLVAFARVMR